MTPHQLLQHMTSVVLLVLTLVSPVRAFFGGMVDVIDRQNLMENIAIAARQLEIIRNQVAQIELMLKHLEALPDSVVEDIVSDLATIIEQIETAQGIGYRLSTIEQEFRRLYPDPARIPASAKAQAEAQATRRAVRRHTFLDAARSQSTVQQLRDDAARLQHIVTLSKTAVGHLQALQAGNELTALEAEGSMRTQAILSTLARSITTMLADITTAEEEAKKRVEHLMRDFGK